MKRTDAVRVMQSHAGWAEIEAWSGECPGRSGELMRAGSTCGRLERARCCVGIMDTRSLLTRISKYSPLADANSLSRHHRTCRGGRIGTMVSVDLSEERRRRRRAGDPRLSPEDRAILRRLVKGDLAEEFQAALDRDLAQDPLLGGAHVDTDD